MSLVVACVLVRGHVDFTPEYVVRLRSMCKRALQPHEFVCLTDQSAYLPGDMRTIKVKKLEGFAWWTKVELFNPKHEWLQKTRCLYLDLDVLVTGELDQVAFYNEGFCAIPHAGDFNGKGDKKVVKRFNSSVMSWNGGEHNDLFTDWTPEVTNRLWGDQDWIGERMGRGTEMPLSWFPRLSQITDRNVEDVINQSKVILCKKPKNLEAAKRWKWFDKAWR